MLVADLKSIMSEKLGIPVSTFRFTCSATKQRHSVLIKSQGKSGKSFKTQRNCIEMYDSNTLDYYGLEIGSKVQLDLWDGWNELIIGAIAGHEKTVSQYFSWNRLERHFQQRVALYIAAYFGHMGLATAMMKHGAKPHEPVGTHPTRKWCLESEHQENTKRPLHVACVRGQLPILRMFCKSSPLCFVMRDLQDRTPIQIALRYHHRTCFEYLLARQWGRKTCNDFTLPVTLYCRIMQWCEKAKARALLMHGTDKSTYKGVPPKVGALVGGSVIVDGYSKKPANSVPYAMIPKPAITPDNMMSALNLARRKLRSMRRKQVSTQSFVRRSSNFSASVLMDDRLASSTTNNSFQSLNFVGRNDVFDEDHTPPQCFHEKELESKSNMRLNKKNLSSQVGGINKKDGVLKTKNVKPGTSGQQLTLPQVNKKAQQSGSRISFKSELNNKHIPKQQSYPPTMRISPYPHPPAAVKRPPVPLKPTITETGIPLPPKSLGNQLKPFFYWSPYQAVNNPVEDTLQRFETYRGMAPRQHAVQCLTVTSAFTEKPWLKQIQMATCLTRRGVRRNLDHDAGHRVSVQ
ncbi:unnamed protein product [Clavelina lepadiformis]